MNDQKQGRIKESDLVVPTLRLLSEAPDGFLTTADLIAELEKVFNPSGHDAQQIVGRNDTLFNQKVRTMISHRKMESSFIAHGYASYQKEARGLRITTAGREFLFKLPCAR